MSDINLSISTGTNVLTQAVGSDEVNLALSSTTNVHTTAIQTQNTLSIDLVGSVTPTSLLGLTDVNASSITNTQILQFDSSSDTFIASDFDLNALTDVTISSVANNQVLAYDATSGNFVNVSLDSDSFNIDASQIAVNLGSGLNGRLVTANSDGTLNAETLAFYDTAGGNELHLFGNATGEPGIVLENTDSSAVGPSYISFLKDKGAAGADGDDIGRIDFLSDDAGQNQTTFARILGEVEVAADGQEGGKLTLSVASHDAEIQPGLVINDGDAEDEVDVIIGNGAASLTTVAGDLSVTTGLILDSVDVTTIQTSAESFVNNDTSLMTSAAIQDQILADAPAVTLAGTPDYITISGQEITRNQIDLTADVTGTLPVANGGTGSTSTTYCDLTSNVTGTLPVANGGTGATSFTANELLFGNGTSAIQSSSNLTYSGAMFSIIDSDSFQPVLKIENTHNSALSGSIIFSKSRDSGTSADGDKIGQIFFSGQDDAGNTGQTYGLIECNSKETGSGQEGGKIFMQVASHDGSSVTGLTIEDGDASGEVDVTIGAGAASTTTVAGTLTMGSTAFVNNSGVIQVATQGTIDHDSLANFSADEHFTQANIVTTGALNSGSITSGFGNIDIGSSTFDTTGDVTTGQIRPTSIGHAISGSNAGDFGSGAEILTGISNDSVTAGAIYVLRDGVWTLIDADTLSTVSQLVGVATAAAGSGNSSNGMIIKGCVTLASAYTAGSDSEGAIVYASATAGEATLTAPSTSNQFVRILGYSLNASSKKMFLNPDNTFVKIA
jgi:hypothetical protein